MNADLKLLQNWIADESFQNWCLNPDSKDYQDWEDWLIRNPEYLPLAEIGANIVRGIPLSPQLVSEERSKASLSQVMNRLGIDQENQKTASKLGLGSLTKFWTIAASIAFLIGLGTWAILTNAQSKWVVVSTNFGEQIQLTLPDETTVMLNANSRIEYHRSNPRDVRLWGEAHFNVKRINKTREKFFVTTPNLTIEVLGTIFNVNSKNLETEVFLEEGKVVLSALGMGDKKVEMIPGEMYSYSRANRKPILKQVDVNPEKQTDWTDGSIEFEDSLTAVCSRLEEIYGLTFQYNESIDIHRQIKVAIPINNQQMAIEVLGKILQADIISDGKSLTINPISE